MAMSFLSLLGARVAASVFTLPTGAGLRLVLGASAIMTAGMFGMSRIGLLKFKPLPSAFTVGWVAAYVMLRSVLEELFFRSALLPHPRVDDMRHLNTWADLARVSILPVLFFAASHALTTQRPAGVVLRDAIFLTLATGLGSVASGVYYATKGSFWAVALLHWLVITPYASLLSGWESLHTPSGMARTTARRIPGEKRAQVAAEPAPATVGKVE